MQGMSSTICVTVIYVSAKVEKAKMIKLLCAKDGTTCFFCHGQVVYKNYNNVLTIPVSTLT